MSQDLSDTVLMKALSGSNSETKFIGSFIGKIFAEARSYRIKDGDVFMLVNLNTCLGKTVIFDLDR